MDKHFEELLLQYVGEPDRASKLGEDIAGPGEILMTEAAFQLLPEDSGLQAEPLELSISGIDLRAVALKY
jgi:hypothetical protein